MTNQDKKVSNWQSERRVPLHINSPQNKTFYTKNFCYLLNFLVNNNTHSVLSNIIHPSSLAMVTLVRHTLLNCTHTLLKQEWRQSFTSFGLKTLKQCQGLLFHKLFKQKYQIIPDLNVLLFVHTFEFIATHVTPRNY